MCCKERTVMVPSGLAFLVAPIVPSGGAYSSYGFRGQIRASGKPTSKTPRRLRARQGRSRMASTNEFDVSRFIDERKMTRFNAALVIWSFFIVLFDGYDISAISFAAPELVKAWAVTDRAALAPAVCASLCGLLVGAPLFARLVD